MKTCKTCKHWDKNERWALPDQYWRACLHPGVDKWPPPMDAAFVSEGEPFNEGRLNTGPDFGCIHHKPEDTDG